MHVGAIKPTRRARGALYGCLCATALALFAPCLASANATSMSTNWAGYVTVPASADAHFRSVSGYWTQPSVTCTTARRSYSAVWVGLGGFREGARGLEQVGTDADCDGSGNARYDSWYELLPAAPVKVRMTVHAGDRMAASVTVRGHEATLRISDLTSGQHFSRTQRVGTLDTSSAEWIVEAPSVCTSDVTCSTLPLSDFGEVSFSSATATLGAHVGPIEDSRWKLEALELQQAATPGSATRTATHVPSSAALIAAVPSAPSEPYGAFSVSWQEASLQLESPGRTTLPSSTGGPP